MNTTSIVFGFSLIGIVICLMYIYTLIKENNNLMKVWLKISQDRESYRLLLEDLVELFDDDDVGVDADLCSGMLKKFSNRAQKLLVKGVNDGKRRKEPTKFNGY